MDRELLKYFLNSGPSKTFDLPKLGAMAQEATGRPPQPFFDTPFLNRSILFKFLDTQDSLHDTQRTPLKTLIYFPYDTARPEDGGESVVYSRSALHHYLTTNKDIQALDGAAFQADATKLDVMESTPAFSPFLLEGAFERKGVAVNTNYLMLDPAEVAVVKSRLRTRLRPLVHAAFSQYTNKKDLFLDKLADSVWSSDVKAILPLVKALRIPERRATETMSSWAGMTFFEQSFTQIEPDMRAFSNWFKVFSMPREALSSELEASMRHTVNHIGRRVQANWSRAVNILQDYQTTYKDFIGEKGRVDPFLSFLRDAKQHFWDLGISLGRIDQTVYAWRAYTRNFEGQRLPYERLSELYFILNAAN